MNHSCDPTVYIDVIKMAVIALVDLKSGDEVNFFYPSTEWEMIKPFPCWCGSQKCLKQITGAKHIERVIMDQFVYSQHIKELMDERDTNII
jgi:hypothetical protein